MYLSEMMLLALLPHAAMSVDAYTFIYASILNLQMLAELVKRQMRNLQ